MAVTSESEGTQTAVISTEHSLATPSSAGVRVLAVDLSNMASGDTLELRIKAKVLAAGTTRIVYYAVFTGAQSADAAIVESVPLASDTGATFTLKQTAGTGRNYDWKVMTL